MLSKKVIKDIQSLSLKKYREATGLFIAEGPKVVTELYNEIPVQFEAIYATEEWIRHNPDIKTSILVADIELEKISQHQSPNQVVAVIRQFEIKEPAPENNYIIYLDTIQDPGNMGTIIRIADWFGLKDIVCSPGCADLYNPKVVQSTMGSIARVNVWYDNDDQWLVQQSVSIMGATLNGKSLKEIEVKPPAIIAFGNESKGLRPEIINRLTEQITIPRSGKAESLNAAVATGIILSHIVS